MIRRREFLAATCAAATTLAARGDDKPPLRAAIIGHTGNGNYGHGMDTLFAGRDNIQVVAVADADAAGLIAAQKRTKAQRAYADYREMLDKEKPQLVSIGPRTTGERRAMLLAVLNSGAHIVSEKPFVQSVADGDEVLALADSKGLKIAVAHQIRLGPSVTHFKKKFDEGLLGQLIEMRAWGKQDKRAGGEELTVLGIHLFDLMRMFAGEAQWCHAVVQEKGRLATLADVRIATEDIGPILGDEIHAQIGFNDGVVGSYSSSTRLLNNVGHWGIEFVGSKGTARLLADIWPVVLLKTSGKWEGIGRTDQWQPIEGDPATTATPAQRANGPANARMVDDWLAAIAENRQPICSGANAVKAIEIAAGVWRAGLSGARVTYPLKERGHPLAKPG